MIPKKKILIADLIILIICFLGVYQISQKATLPFEVISTKSGPLIDSKKSQLYFPFDGFEVQKVNSIKVNNTDEIEFILDGFRIDSSVKILLSMNGKTFEKTFSLIPFYSKWYFILVFFTGILIFALSLIVLLKCTDKQICIIFHWLGISTTVILMTTWGNYNIPNFITGVIIKIFFTAAYSYLPSLFVHFTLVFPNKKLKVFPKLIPIMYTISTISFVSVTIAFVLTFQNLTHITMQTYDTMFRILRIILAVFLIIGMINFVRSYRSSKTIKEKKKLKWVLTGIISAPVVFILFWFIPGVFFNIRIIPEEIIIIFVAFVPITFAISIIRYNLFDIDSLINRGVVYSITIGISIALYLVIILMLSKLIIHLNPNISAVLAAASVALLFQPAKNKIQKFVDKKFFRVQYNFRKEVTLLLNEIKNSLDIKSLADTIVEKINNLIPVEKIGFFLLEEDFRLKILSHKNFDLLEGRSIKFEKTKLKTILPVPVALPESLESGLKIEVGESEMFNRWKIKLIYPIKSVSDNIYAFIVLDKKKDDSKFSREDFDLIASVTSTAANTMERIKLQKEVIKEHLETERLEELNKLKSFFFSRVSHDLKTPLTSIRMFAEMLRDSSNTSILKNNEYLDIIEGESNRLTRLIDNVLDFTKIEKGIKEYNFELVNIDNIVNDVIKSMEYQFKMEKFTVNISLSKNNTLINADSDAVFEALINLLSNAIKYSKEDKVIDVLVYRNKDYMSVDIKDKGIGISAEEQTHLFEPYFRSKELYNKKPEGVGLGLAIVKHIMDAHKGSIIINSKKGTGSCFTLNFPMAYEK